MFFKENLIKLTIKDKQLHFEINLLMHFLKEVSFFSKNNVANFHFLKNTATFVIATILEFPTH